MERTYRLREIGAYEGSYKLTTLFVLISIILVLMLFLFLYGGGTAILLELHRIGMGV
jgi:hypothetical protein